MLRWLLSLRATTASCSLTSETSSSHCDIGTGLDVPAPGPALGALQRLLQEAQPCRVGSGNLHKLVSAHVNDVVSQIVRFALPQSGSQPPQAGLQRAHPSIGLIPARVQLSRPILCEAAIWLVHGDHGVEPRRSRANNTYMPAPHLHRTSTFAVSTTSHPKMLQSDEDVLATQVHLRRPLLQDILDTQRVEAILHRKRQQQLELAVPEVNPAYRAAAIIVVLCPHDASVAKEELTHLHA
eukprot:CAMPEP_0115143598 /NCGR_PEP_ID=MMETSP0227-20121206/60893_1 /TAXON_ID=89957 /ORGANISM="Polarella glacialis, Strain CCMP 1383" /LENGTH=238 /DNA_ID=CAMNT_0002552511 /DNA_START=488 /DNA_END=1203 /DNA_ORIENTATION=-